MMTFMKPTISQGSQGGQHRPGDEMFHSFVLAYTLLFFFSQELFVHSASVVIPCDRVIGGAAASRCAMSRNQAESGPTKLGVAWGFRFRTSAYKPGLLTGPNG